MGEKVLQYHDCTSGGPHRLSSLDGAISGSASVTRLPVQVSCTIPASKDFFTKKQYGLGQTNAQMNLVRPFHEQWNRARVSLTSFQKSTYKDLILFPGWEPYMHKLALKAQLLENVRNGSYVWWETKWTWFNDLADMGKIHIAEWKWPIPKDCMRAYS